MKASFRATAERDNEEAGHGEIGAAAHNRRPPEYTLRDRSGPHHAPQFTVSVSVGPAGEATATGASKQEAETAAAAALLDKLG